MAVLTVTGRPAAGADGSPATGRRYRLGACVVDREEATITRGEHRIALTPRTMLVLDCLVASAGAAVPRDTLLDAAWQHRDVGDESLSRAISDLRQALGDTPRTPRYIETIPRVGYRLVAEISPLAEDAAGRRRLRRVGPPLAVAALLAAALAWLLPARPPDPPSPGGFAPLAAGPSLEHSPALNADGDRVWFVAVDRYASGHVPRSTIHVMRADGSGLEAIHEREGDVITGFAVTPDERRIAFAADDGFVCRIFVRDVDGGAPGEIGRCGAPSNVQRLAWVGDCLAYSGHVEPDRQALQTWCPAGASGPALPDEAGRSLFPVPLAYRAEPAALLLASASGHLAYFDMAAGTLTESREAAMVHDAVFADERHALVLASDRGEHTLTTLALPQLAAVERVPTVPFANFIERAANRDAWVLGTFGWQRKLGVLDLSDGSPGEVGTPERGSFHNLSVASDGSHVVFARRGPGGWRVWSRRLDMTAGEAGEPHPVSPAGRETRIALALPGAVLHVEAIGEAGSRLVRTRLAGDEPTVSHEVPFRITSLFAGPGDEFAAHCEGGDFVGICRGNGKALTPWVGGAATAAWDAVREIWYVAVGSTVSQVTTSGLLPSYELPAAQSTGRWAVHAGRVYAFTRDRDSATPTLLSRSLSGPDDERTHPIDADGWNLTVSRDGRLFYTEQVYDSGTADLFIAAARD